ncbi:MAG: hypothetical protein JWP52_4146, partial [Rhizobacter sp.]|nr:hypothetical protein [Rhizobacter sp.]
MTTSAHQPASDADIADAQEHGLY